MGLNADLLRSSFALVAERNPSITHSFYDILFSRYPQVQPLFGRNARSAQEKMLAEALVAVLDHLEDAPWLQSTLEGLGRKHEGYGVTREMYPWVGECLIAAMAQAAGVDWTDEMTEAWAAAYGAICDMMFAGYEA